jgi:hypothetical protein
MFRTSEKVLEKLLSELNLYCQEDPDMQIDIEHALEAVRTNGWMRLCTLVLILKQFHLLKQRWQKYLLVHNRIVPMVESELAKLTELIREVKLCPVCNGEQGSGDALRSRPSGWKDCEYCNGRGLKI